MASAAFRSHPRPTWHLAWLGWALFAGLLWTGCSSAAQLDGLHVVNGGSTNTAGWEIALRSDGSATVTVTGSAVRGARFRSALVARTFADVKAARASHGSGWHSCIKSVSFGSVTRVHWHGWTSPDLTCPATTPAVASLAADIAELQAQARLVSPQRRTLPPEVRRVPPSKGR